MKYALVILTLSFLSCATVSNSAGRPGSDRAIEEFLTSWLVDQRPIDQFLNENFTLPTGDELSDSWPGELQAMPPRPRTLEFGRRCGASCRDLPSCIRKAAVSEDGLYDLQRYLVTEEMVRQMPGLQDLLGRDVLEVVFVLRQCNVAAYVIFDADKSATRRVRTITYLAP